MKNFEVQEAEEFTPWLEKLVSEETAEEYQAWGDYREGKFEKRGEDAVNIWIGKTKAGECYIGVAGRQAPMSLSPDHYYYFRTIGYQQISEQDYEALKKVPSFTKVK